VYDPLMICSDGRTKAEVVNDAFRRLTAQNVGVSFLTSAAQSSGKETLTFSENALE